MREADKLTDALDSRLTQRYAYVESVLTYAGYALPGVADDAPFWRIKKFTYNGSGAAVGVDFADGSAEFDKSWALRTGYTY